MAASGLARLAFELERLGLPNEELMRLHVEASALERPPGLAARLSASTAQLVRGQWAHLLGEWRESREAFGLLQRRLRGDDPLSAAEEERLRAQLLDLLRLVPAGMIAGASFAIPLPGAFLLTPALLGRLNLLPGRWREARLQRRIQAEVERVRAAGQNGLAERLAAVQAELEREAEVRDQIARDGALLRVASRSEAEPGAAPPAAAWSEAERRVYQRGLAELAAVARRADDHRTWFVLTDDRVFGPTRVGPLLALTEAEGLMVRHQSEPVWVALPDLQRACRAPELAPPERALFEAATRLEVHAALPTRQWGAGARGRGLEDDDED